MQQHRPLADPHLLDCRIVEVLLQRSEPGDGVEYVVLRSS